MVDLKSLREKYLTYVIIILIALIVGYYVIKKFQVSNLFIVLIVIGLIAYFLLQKPKIVDVYKAVEIIQLRHLKSFGEYLDESNVEATEIPPGSGRLLIAFKNNAKVFEFQNSMVLGIQIKNLSDVVYNYEKSRLVEQASKQVTIKDQLKQGAEKLGIDPASLGINE